MPMTFCRSHRIAMSAAVWSTAVIMLLLMLLVEWVHAQPAATGFTDATGSEAPVFACSPSTGLTHCAAAAFQAKYGDPQILQLPSPPPAPATYLGVTSLSDSEGITRNIRTPQRCRFVDVTFLLKSTDIAKSGDYYLSGAGLYPVDVHLGAAAVHAGLIRTTPSQADFRLRAFYVGRRRVFYSLLNNSLRSRSAMFNVSTAGSTSNPILGVGRHWLPATSADEVGFPAIWLTRTPASPGDAAPTCPCTYLPNNETSTPLVLPQSWYRALLRDLATANNNGRGASLSSKGYEALRNATSLGRERVIFANQFLRSFDGVPSTLMGAGYYHAQFSDVFYAFWLSAAASHVRWIRDSVLNIGAAAEEWASTSPRVWPDGRNGTAQRFGAASRPAAGTIAAGLVTWDRLVAFAGDAFAASTATTSNRSTSSSFDWSAYAPINLVVDDLGTAPYFAGHTFHGVRRAPNPTDVVSSDSLQWSSGPAFAMRWVLRREYFHFLGAAADAAAAPSSIGLPFLTAPRPAAPHVPFMELAPWVDGSASRGGAPSATVAADGGATDPFFNHWFPVLIAAPPVEPSQLSPVFGVGEYALATDVTSAAVFGHLSRTYSTLVRSQPTQPPNEFDEEDLISVVDPAFPGTSPTDPAAPPPVGGSIAVVLLRLTGWRSAFYQTTQMGLKASVFGNPNRTYSVASPAYVLLPSDINTIQSLYVIATSFESTWRLQQQAAVANGDNPSFPEPPHFSSVTAMSFRVDRAAAGDLGPNATYVPRIRTERLSTATVIGTGIYHSSTDLVGALHHHGRLLTFGDGIKDFVIHVVRQPCAILFYRSTFLGLRSDFLDSRDSPAQWCFTVNKPTTPTFLSLHRRDDKHNSYDPSTAYVLPSSFLSVNPRRVVLWLTHDYAEDGGLSITGTGVYAATSQLDLTSAAYHAQVIAHDDPAVIFVHETKEGRPTYFMSTHRGVASTPPLLSANSHVVLLLPGVFF